MDVALIATLAKVMPTLIVGDDDQALYAFRNASPEAIRDLARADDFERFDLPFCTRCTEVVVAATHTVIHRAQSAGLLEERLDKPYECYTPSKQEDSQRYPNIIHAHCSTHTSRAPYVSRYIEHAIRHIPVEDIQTSHAEKIPTVLIIGPNPFLSQVESHLREHFSNVVVSPRNLPELDSLYAYGVLANDPDSNLAWRILLQLLQPPGWEAAVSQGLLRGEGLRTLLDPGFLGEHLRIAQLLLRENDGAELSSEERDDLAAALGVVQDNLDERLHPTPPDAEEIDESEPIIMLTSLMGSKGLQAEHVFVIGVNEGHFPRNASAITNEEVCQLLVALTRTRKCCTIVSTGRFAADWVGESRFIEWLGPHLQTIQIDRTFFN